MLVEQNHNTQFRNDGFLAAFKPDRYGARLFSKDSG